MGYCSINVVEMRALVSSLISAETTVRGNASAMSSLMQGVWLDTGEVSRAVPVSGWIADELVPTRRRLAMAEALVAATPGLGTFVQFDESAISTKTPAQAAADAKRAVALMKAGDTKGLLAILSTEAYDPYFAAAFAKGTTPRDLEKYVTSFGLGQLGPGVDPKQYESVLTGLGQTLGLATRNQGELALPKSWTMSYVEYMTFPPDLWTESESQATTDLSGRSALMLLMARGQWSTPFLQQATKTITSVEKNGPLGTQFWLGINQQHAVTPQGKQFYDPMIALMAALGHNPQAASWAFTQGGTTDMPLGGHQVPVNSFLHYVLLDRKWFQDDDSAVAILALQAAVGGNKFSPVAMDVHTITESLKEQKAARDAMPWYEKWGHTILDVLGMIPVFGDIANAPNAAWYAADGDWVDAGITGAGMIPLIGDVALGARVFKDGADVVKGLDTVEAGLKVLQVGAMSEKDISNGVYSARLLQKATEIEPAVFKFDKLDDFRLAANAPHPNVTYEFNGIRYTTDELGRPIRVTGRPINLRGMKDPALRRAIGKGADAQSGDVGFHLFAESFGGPTTRLNVVPGNGVVSRAQFTAFKNLNTSEYAKMENQVRAALKDPKIADVDLTVEPVYLTDSTRPESFYAELTIDGEVRTFVFDNAPVRR